MTIREPSIETRNERTDVADIGVIAQDITWLFDPNRSALEDLGVDDDLASEARKFASQFIETTRFIRTDLPELLHTNVEPRHIQEPSTVDIEKRLSEVIKFLELCQELSENTEELFDKRAIAIEIGGVLEESSVSLEDVRDAARDELVGLYLQLGEIGSAIRKIQVAIDPVFAQREAESHAPWLKDMPIVHLSRPRMKLHIEQNVELFGETQFDAITKHVTDCETCKKAYESVQTAGI